MKRTPLLVLLAFFLTSCDTWMAPPQPFPVWTPIPTITPSIVTATPLILPPPTFDIPATSGATVIVAVTPTNTNTPHPSPTFSAVPPTETLPPPAIQAVEVEILGCNTSLDILRGMGEVTNAYVLIKNSGTLDLPNTCGLLRAIDEGREHPDKKVCVTNLPAQFQVTLKLTVDSTYRQDTIIQVDITSNEVILLRVDRHSCRSISILGGAPSDTGVVQPIP